MNKKLYGDLIKILGLDDGCEISPETRGGAAVENAVHNGADIGDPHFEVTCKFQNPAYEAYDACPEPGKEGLRPREKLVEKGKEALSDAELLSLLLNTGVKGKSVMVLAKELLELLNAKNGIPSLKNLSKISGLGKAKACLIIAMLEFGRRRWGCRGARIRFPDNIFNLIRHYADSPHENFITLSLNGAKEVLRIRTVTKGLVNKTIIHPREVFAGIIKDRASAFCVAHNHPSGNIQPSAEDNEVTLRLKEAADLLGIQFLDHLIFCKDDFYSYKQSETGIL